jgi:hypothetical protein
MVMPRNHYKMIELDKFDFEYKEDDRSLFFIEVNCFLLHN